VSSEDFRISGELTFFREVPMRYPPLRNLVIAIVMTGTCVAVSGALPAPETTAPVADPGLETAVAHDLRLDLAHASIKSAINLLLASQNPVASNPDRPFGGHRTKAIRYLERATEEILAAMDYADQ
jgi:hypothetical protein